MERITEIREFVENTKDYGDFMFFGNDLLKHIKYYGRTYNSFTYFSPKDRRCCFFDFSYWNKNQIMLFDAWSGDKVKEMTVKEFLKEYKDMLFYSTTHWEVKWNW